MIAIRIPITIPISSAVERHGDRDGVGQLGADSAAVLNRVAVGGAVAARPESCKTFPPPKRNGHCAKTGPEADSGARPQLPPHRQERPQQRRARHQSGSRDLRSARGWQADHLRAGTRTAAGATILSFLRTKGIKPHLGGLGVLSGFRRDGGRYVTRGSRPTALLRWTLPPTHGRNLGLCASRYTPGQCRSGKTFSSPFESGAGFMQTPAS